MSSNIFKFTARGVCVGLVAAFAGLGLPMSNAVAQQADVFGGYYQREQAPYNEQAKVVFFRTQDGENQAAHVYLDGELESALLPGGYTVFCMAPGSHSLESYINDAPAYAGKRSPQMGAEFQGGKVYFVQVSPDASNHTPIVRKRDEAEATLGSLRRQTHVLDRASATRPCTSVQETTFSVRADVLFAFAKGGYNDITNEGRAELGRIADAIKTQGTVAQDVTVNGYADPIGRDAINQRLSQQRAETVRLALLEMGLSSDKVQAAGHGSSNPVVECPTNKPLRERIVCNAPNRRVDITMRALKVEN